MTYVYRNICIFLLISCLLLTGGFAQQYTVAIKDAPPFVDTSDMTGFSLDLIRAMYPSAQLNYVIYPDVLSHIDAVANGSAHIGIAATTITASREAVVDFSHPFYESNLGVVVKQSQARGVVQLLFSPEMLTIVAILILYMIACGHIIWLIERGKGFDKKYKKGIRRGMWWTLVTMSTVGYGDVVPETQRGKLFGSFVIVTGILLFGVIIAQLSSLSVAEQGAVIDSVDELAGKRVAVIAGTQSADVVGEYGANIVIVPTIEEGFESVEARKVSAFVHDVPLMHPISDGLVIVDEFAPSDYGIMVGEGDALREDVSRRLLKIFETGQYDLLVQKWFG